MTDRYTRRAEDSGWLSVRLTRGGALTSLCEYTRVKVTREDAGRTYFIIKEGFTSVGEEASLKTENATKYLVAAGPGGAATVVATYRGAPAGEVSPFKGPLRQQWAELSFEGQTALVTLNSVWGGSYTPIAPGTHAILAPDYSHKAIATTGYVAATPGMVGNDVWFPIGINGALHSSSRYIHVGHLSEGCVTVHQLERWTALYRYLISHRVAGSGGKRVGSLVVRK